MPNLGPTEFLVIGLILVLLFAAVVAGLVLLVRRAAAPSVPVDMKGPPDPSDLRGQAQRLVEQGKKIHAVKLVRERTGLSLTEAKRYVDDLAAGRLPQASPALPYHGVPPAPSPSGGADLAARVRALKLSGRAEQAVFLVRGETGMTESDAWRFVESIQ